jgi:hypothetical protein
LTSINKSPFSVAYLFIIAVNVRSRTWYPKPLVCHDQERRTDNERINTMKALLLPAALLSGFCVVSAPAMAASSAGGVTETAPASRSMPIQLVQRPDRESQDVRPDRPSQDLRPDRASQDVRPDRESQDAKGTKQ